MTLVTIDITDVVGEFPANGRVAFYSPSNRGVGGRIISTAVKYADLVDGKAEIELVPGPVAVQIFAQGISDTRTKPGFVPDEGPVSLPDVILKWTPPLIDQGVLAVLAAAEGAILTIANVVEESFQAEAQEFSNTTQEALSRAKAAEGVAATADVKSTSATSTASTAASTASNAAARVTALEAMGGLSPESPVDGQTANLIGQPDTLTRAALMDAGNEAFLTRRSAVHSTFLDTPDGARPTHTDSGHEWAYVSPQGQEVRNGNLRSVVGDFGTHPHAEIQMGANITRMGVKFRFSSEGGTRSGDSGIALVAWGDGGLTSPGGLKKTRAHVDLTPTSCGLAVSEHSAPNWGLSIIGGRYTFPKRLAFDTWHTLEFYIMGDSAAIVMPDGYVHVVSDPRIGNIESTTADFELNQIPTGSNAAIPEFREVWADATPVPADGGNTPALQALHGLGKAADPTVRYGDALKFHTLQGDSAPLMSLDSAGNLRISNGLATEPRTEVRFRKDGLIDVARGGSVRISVNEDGDLYPRKLVFSSSKHSISLGSGSPEGVVTDPAGSLYIQHNGGRGGVLWQREVTDPGNAGWRPVGHPAGTSSRRPASPVVGLSYFDTTLGKPIWWSGTSWVGADGSDPDAPPTG